MDIKIVTMRSYDDSQEIEFVQFDKLAVLFDKKEGEVYIHYDFGTFQTGFYNHKTLREFCDASGYVLKKEQNISINIDENIFNELDFVQFTNGYVETFRFKGFMMVIYDTIHIVDTSKLTFTKKSMSKFLKEYATSYAERLGEVILRVNLPKGGITALAFKIEKLFALFNDYFRGPGELTDMDLIEERFREVAKTRKDLIKGKFSLKSMLEGYEFIIETYDLKDILEEDKELKAIEILKKEICREVQVYLSQKKNQQ